jgi:iron complex transport system substrate-binding protein
MPEQRIISLLPSATETVCALGLQDRLVGRSHECDYPPVLDSLPVCSRPRYMSDGPSPEIDREVKSILRSALSIYNVDVGMITRLQPTHIITQSQCAVCAVSTEELRDALCEVLRMDSIHVIDLSPHTLEEVFADILRITDALDAHRQGHELVEKMKASFWRTQSMTQDIPDKPRVAHIEWIDPMMVAGHWMMSLIEMAGGTNVFPDEHNRWITIEDLVRQNPDKIVIAPCGFSIERSLKDIGLLQATEGWRELKAVRSNEVHLSDGSAYFNRPGPRLTDSLEILAEVFHPRLFSGKHHESGWIKLDGHPLTPGWRK